MTTSTTRSPALRKIPVDQARLGMHLHAFEGAWTDHPFWKTNFVLRDVADLTKLRASAVREIWIDVERGLDVLARDERPSLRPAAVAPPAASPWRRSPAAAAPARAASAADADDGDGDGDGAGGPAPRVSMREELDRAAKLCRQSREAVGELFAQARMGRAIDAARCLPLVDSIADSVYRNAGALISLARIRSADEYTYMHSMTVCALMVALGQRLGLDDAVCREAGLAGMLHDLGKAQVPTEILNKPGKLTDDEFAVMRTHPELGLRMLEQAGAGLGGDGDAAAAVCLLHHERVDGTGYPKRLAGDAIPRLARMGAVCDVYDAVTSNRPYKAGWDPGVSIARMASWQGHFDETIFREFVRSLGIYPNGALVRLASGRLAVVVEQHPTTLTAPKVQVFFDTRRELPLRPTLLDLADAARAGGDAIVDREPRERWNFPHLDALALGDDVLERSR